MMYFSRSLLIILYLIVVYLFKFFLDYLEYTNIFFQPGYLKNDLETLNLTFDYIIVGCGSAGAIVAQRLSQNRNINVLILEAGGYGNKLLDIPSLGLLLQKTKYDWQFTTVPQSDSCFALNNNVSHWPMGKIVGGGGILNNMIYVNGHPDDYEEWFKDKQGFNNSNDVLPYLKAPERSGFNFIQDIPFTSVMPEFLLSAARHLGFNVVDSMLNCEKGFGTPKFTMMNGNRWTPSHEIVSHTKTNLFLYTNRLVEKILFHHNFEAYGLEYQYANKKYIVRAQKGIILSAGVVGSPKILMHSGIGPKKHLQDLNITLILDLPVGENLQDHLTTGFDLILLNQSLGIGIKEMMSPLSAFEYFWKGQGPWTTGGCEVIAFLNVNSKTPDAKPDLQFMIMPLGINEDRGTYLRHLIGVSDYTWNNYFALSNQTTMTILPILLHPKSKGTIRLKDSDVNSKPLIDPKYLSHPEDVKILIEGVHLIKRLIETEAMQRLGAKFNKNVFPGCENFAFDTEPYWECYVRHLTITSYHPSGTCKMGPANHSSTVVDFNFSVKGTSNLYVVDASIFPSPTSGNPIRPIFVLAEMASDVFKLQDFMSNGTCNVREIFIKRYIC